MCFISPRNLNSPIGQWASYGRVLPCTMNSSRLTNIGLIRGFHRTKVNPKTTIQKERIGVSLQIVQSWKEFFLRFFAEWPLRVGSAFLSRQCQAHHVKNFLIAISLKFIENSIKACDDFSLEWSKNWFQKFSTAAFLYIFKISAASSFNFVAIFRQIR